MFGKESVPVAGQVAVMSAALVGTGSSTLLLNLCVSPYVFRMAEVKGTVRRQSEHGLGQTKGCVVLEYLPLWVYEVY